MEQIFADAGVHYDRFDYESDYLTPARYLEIVERLRATGKLFEDEHGRLVLDLDGFDLPSRNPVLVITRGNKTSLYVLRDIAYTLDKVAAAADLNLVVLGEDQKLYHRQLQAALSLLGSAAPAAVHYSYVILGKESMSTRQGNVVLLEEFTAEAKRKAAAELAARGHPADPVVAATVAYSALKYSFLRVANDKQVVFDWASGDCRSRGRAVPTCCTATHASARSCASTAAPFRLRPTPRSRRWRWSRSWSWSSCLRRSRSR